MKIISVFANNNEKILREKTQIFDFKKYDKKEINELIRAMRELMKKERGVGLAANQIGLNIRLFITQVENKFYAVFNPEIEKMSDETVVADEGCLSVPEKFGPTERALKVVLKGYDKNEKLIRIKAWGLLARVFQHEVDHLDGKLFIDRAKVVHSLDENIK